MEKTKKCVVITTINEPKNNALSAFSKLKDFDLIIAGDSKSPKKYDLNCSYVSVDVQEKDFPTLNALIPFRHYARKNLGYLYAIKNGYEIIAESDDDNYPYKGWFTLPEGEKFPTIVSPSYPNIYSLFTKKHVWPRGFPLDLVKKKEQITLKNTTANVMVWQGLVDGDPDVDAVYRLSIGDDNITFSKNKHFVLEKGIVSAFNTQNTVWKKEAQYLMYLPFSVNFRYTDILKSFVAQYGIWALNGRVGFTSPTAEQKRNEHNLLHDFIDEVQMHELFYMVMDTLNACELKGNPSDLITMYKALLEANVVTKDELKAVREWVRLYNQYAEGK